MPQPCPGGWRSPPALPWLKPAPLLPPPVQDPGWALEARLVGMLSRHGKQPFATLLQRLGNTPLPDFLAAEPGGSREAALKQLIENRPQLFDVVMGDTIQLQKGGRREDRCRAIRALWSGVSPWAPGRAALLCPGSLVASSAVP